MTLKIIDIRLKDLEEQLKFSSMNYEEHNEIQLRIRELKFLKFLIQKGKNISQQENQK